MEWIFGILVLTNLLLRKNLFFDSGTTFTKFEEFLCSHIKAVEFASIRLFYTSFSAFFRFQYNYGFFFCGYEKWGFLSFSLSEKKSAPLWSRSL